VDLLFQQLQDEKLHSAQLAKSLQREREILAYVREDEPSVYEKALEEIACADERNLDMDGPDLTSKRLQRKLSELESELQETRRAKDEVARMLDVTEERVSELEAELDKERSSSAAIAKDMKRINVVEHDFTDFFVERELKNEENLESLGKENHALKLKLNELEKLIESKNEVEKYRREIETKQAECIQRFSTIQSDILQHKSLLGNKDNMIQSLVMEKEALRLRYAHMLDVVKSVISDQGLTSDQLTFLQEAMQILNMDQAFREAQGRTMSNSQMCKGDAM